LTLFGRRMIPLHSLRVVLRHALPGFVKDAEIELCGSVALLSCFPEPLSGLAEFRGNTHAGLITEAEVALGRRIILFGRASQPRHRLLMILLDALTCLVTNSQRTLGSRVALLGSGSQFIERLPGSAVSMCHSKTFVG